MGSLDFVKSLNSKNETRRVSIDGIEFGGNNFVVVAGPCSIESSQHLKEVAQSVGSKGASLLRGGIWKMRTSADSFQGLGTKAFEFIPQVLRDVNMGLISEITDPRHIEFLHPIVSAFQVGSRNMHNYELLKELGRVKKPVLLKRGFGALISEWIKAAEYIEKGGNSDIVLCERGIRTFETATRNTLDLNAVAHIKEFTNYPVIVDPSHAVGISRLVPPISLAALAAGADGLIVEVHPRPHQALSDGDQALNYEDFENLMRKIQTLCGVVGRKLPGPKYA